MYIYCVYPAMSKSQKDLPNLTGKRETGIVVIVFNGILCPYFCCSRFLPFSLHEPGRALLPPSLNNTELYLTPLLVPWFM
jgi:hypothetical protein